MREKKRDNICYKDICTLENLIIMNSQLRHFVPLTDDIQHAISAVNKSSRGPDRSRSFLSEFLESILRFLFRKVGEYESVLGFSLCLSFSVPLSRASKPSIKLFFCSHVREEKAPRDASALSRADLRVSRRPLPRYGNNASPATATATASVMVMVIYRTTDRIVAWSSRAFASSITRVGKATRKNGVGGKRNGRGRVFHYPVCLIPGRFWCVGHRFSPGPVRSFSLFSLPSNRTAPCLRVFKSTTHPLYMCARQ